ncbi:MAG: Gfo/Idh/MocA family oxidoreductase [Christensenella sp.]|nr:Gfo/Idh/MocA family oxidoreductase [Christensenella sp.]
MKYATIGTSGIASQMIEAAGSTGLWELDGVYSRSLARAQEFGAGFGCSRAYNSLSALAKSRADAIYIASPNALHYEQCQLFLQAGKHVICEKPLTVTPQQSHELAQLAQQNNVVLMEAIMMVHQPQRRILKAILPEIGNITGVHLDFSQLSSRYAAFCSGELPNIFNPEFAAGCLMDLGVYCVYLALDLFGFPKSAFTTANFLSTGADGSFTSIFHYPGFLLTLTACKTGQDRCGSEILGDQGTISIEFVHHLSGISLFHTDGSKDIIFGDVEKRDLMANEMRDFYRYITDPEGSAAEYHAAQKLSLDVSKMMLQMRVDAGYPF